MSGDRLTRLRLARAALTARALILWERLAGVWTPLVLALLALAALGLWGAPERLGPLGWLLAAGAVALTAAAAAVRAVLALRLPAEGDVRRRIEAGSGASASPFAALEETPATGDPALWALHRRRAAEAARKAGPGRPRAGMAAADPFALRYALVLALALGFWVHGREGGERALAALGTDFTTAARAETWSALASGRTEPDHPVAAAVAEASASLRAERRPYEPSGDEAAWPSQTERLSRAPSGVQDAADILAGLDAEALDPATRSGLAWALRRLQTAESLKEAKRIAPELDALARHIERRRAPVPGVEAQAAAVGGDRA